MRIKNLLPFAFCLIAFLFLGCSENNNKNEKPNVVLFLIDDFGYGDISFEGNTVVKTPGIDRIATEGVRFTRFYQSAGACAPTRAALLTGRDYLKTGVWGVHWGRDYIHRDENTLGNLMQSAGYKTGVFGKWHSGKTWAYFGWNRGFDVSVHTSLYSYWNTKVLYNNKIVKVAGPMPNVVGDQVIKFITENHDNPFFAYVPFQSIHGPYNCPDSLFLKFKGMGFSEHVARVLGMTEQMDKNVKRILDALDENNLSENTIVMFMVDDGCSPAPDLSFANRRMNKEEHEQRASNWGYRLRGTKAQIWEGGSRSPFYMRWPAKLEAGKEITDIAGVLDIYPTLADICNIRYPENQKPLDGKSLYPFLNGENPEWSERMYFDNTNLYQIEETRFDVDSPRIREKSVQYKDFKYIKKDNVLYGRDTIEHFLFNLAEDRQETNNLAVSNPEMKNYLENASDEWYKDILATSRAFTHPVYSVGHWQERGSPINLDGASKISGTLKRNPGSGFYFTNWNKTGNALSFNIDVAQTGKYKIELLQQNSPENEGGALAVFTEYDTIRSVLSTGNSTFFDDTLFLPEGEQTLTVQLVETGQSGKALDWLNLLVVHRIPGEMDDVLRNAGISLQSPANAENQIVSPMQNATLYFMREYNDIVYSLKAGENFNVTPFADNPELIAQVDYFIDFEKVETIKSSPYNFKHHFEQPGSYTLNVEFTDKNGVKNSSRVQLEVL